jgi:threonine synthase
MAYFEASDQVPGGIDWYVQAGVERHGRLRDVQGREGAESHRPRRACAQASLRAAGKLRAARQCLTSKVPRRSSRGTRSRVRTGIAEAILRGDPSRVYPYVKSIVVESGGDCVSVTENEIREARRLTEESEGVSPCFSAATAVAGLIRKWKAASFRARTRRSST